MGSEWSTPEAGPPEVLRHEALKLLNPHESRSLASNMKRIKTPEQLSEFLGISGCAGNDVMVRIVFNLAFNDFKRYAVLAVALLTNKLRLENELLFEAVSSGKIGAEPYIKFKELECFVVMVVSAFDWDPAHFGGDIQPICIADQLLRPIRAPAVRFSQFNQLIGTWPFLLDGLHRIWDRMLLDSASVVPRPQPPGPAIFLERPDLAVLHIARGPLKSPKLLFKASVDGFSMRVLESNSKFWEGGGMLILVKSSSEVRAGIHVSESMGSALVQFSPRIEHNADMEVQIRYGKGICSSALTVDDDLKKGRLHGRTFYVHDVEIYGVYE